MHLINPKTNPPAPDWNKILYDEKFYNFVVTTSIQNYGSEKFVAAPSHYLGATILNAKKDGDNITSASTSFMTLAQLQNSKNDYLVMTCDGVSTPIDRKAKTRGKELSEFIVNKISEIVLPHRVAPKQQKVDKIEVTPEIEAGEQKTLDAAYQYAEQHFAQPTPKPVTPTPTPSNNGKTVVVERGHGGSGHDDKQDAKWEAPDPKKDWLAWLAHQAMQRRAQTGSKPIVNDIIWKKSLGNNKEDAEAAAAETMLQIFPQEEWGDKYKNIPADEFKKQILALATERNICRIAQEGKEYVFRIAAEPENQADVDKLIKQEKLTEDDQYNAAYRLQLYIHGHQFFGHGNQPETKIKTGFGPPYDLAAGIENVDFDPATNSLRVKLLDTTDAQGAAQAGGTVDITKDKLSASSVDGGSLAVLVASAKAAQWDSYKITAEGDGLIQTAIAFILNGLDLDGETQTKVLEAVNARQPEDQQLKDYKQFENHIKSAPQQSQQPEPAGG